MAAAKKSAARVEEDLKALGVKLDAPGWTKAGMPTSWRDKVLEAAVIQDQIAVLTTNLKALKEDIKEAQIRNGEKAIIVGDWRCRVYEGHSSKLDKKKLLEYGVTVEIIEKSTVTTEYIACKISPIKEAGDGQPD